MDRRYKIKVWKDRLAGVYPAKWSWEVLDRTAGGKVVGCGTTISEATSRDAASRVVDRHQQLFAERRAVHGRSQAAWPTSTPFILGATRDGARL